MKGNLPRPDPAFATGWQPSETGPPWAPWSRLRSTGAHWALVSQSSRAQVQENAMKAALVTSFDQPPTYAEVPAPNEAPEKPILNHVEPGC